MIIMVKHNNKKIEGLIKDYRDLSTDLCYDKRTKKYKEASIKRKNINNKIVELKLELIKAEGLINFDVIESCGRTYGKIQFKGDQDLCLEVTIIDERSMNPSDEPLRISLYKGNGQWAKFMGDNITDFPAIIQKYADENYEAQVKRQTEIEFVNNVVVKSPIKISNLNHNDKMCSEAKARYKGVKYDEYLDININSNRQVDGYNVRVDLRLNNVSEQTILTILEMQEKIRELLMLTKEK